MAKLKISPMDDIKDTAQNFVKLQFLWISWFSYISRTGVNRCRKFSKSIPYVVWICNSSGKNSKNYPRNWIYLFLNSEIIRVKYLKEMSKKEL